MSFRPPATSPIATPTEDDTRIEFLRGAKTMLGALFAHMLGVESRINERVDARIDALEQRLRDGAANTDADVTNGNDSA